MFAAEENFVLRRGHFMSLNEQSVDETGLKVMWWNVGCSSTRGLKELSERDRDLIDPVHQWSNIAELINSNRLRPDVLILGEYCPSAFDDPTYKLIRKKYKYKFRLNKSNPLYNIRNGLRVFSRYKIRDVQEGVLKAESFVDSDLMQNCDAAVKKRNPKSFGKPAFWNRPKITFKIRKDERTYKIAPIHLANPWSFVKSCAGIWKTPGVIKDDKTNANYLQAEQLVESFSEEESMILIGDFNAPKKILGGSSKTYRYLREFFGESAVASDLYTFDDPRRNFPAYSIDHAFVSGDLDVKNGVVLPFAGSDHLPIYIVVD